jgi:phosphotransferase system HPr-like phosphotransfer protein
MGRGGTTISAQFLGNFSIASSDPLLGVFELSTSADTTIEVVLDSASAEALLSALVQFLAQGQAAEFDDGM